MLNQRKIILYSFEKPNLNKRAIYDDAFENSDESEMI